MKAKDPNKMTPAKAKKLRHAAMKACGCLLCCVATNQPKSFAEHAETMRLTAEMNAGIEAEHFDVWMSTKPQVMAKQKATDDQNAYKELSAIVRSGVRGYRIPVMRRTVDGKCKVLDAASLDCQPQASGKDWVEVLAQIKKLAVKAA